MQNNPLSKYAFGLSLFINALLFGACYLLLYPHFGTVDDTEMQLVLSGQMLSPEPSPAIRWSNWYLGELLAALYRFNPTVPWYGLQLYAGHFFAMQTLLYVMLRIKASRWRIVLYILLFLIAEVPLLQEVQFTSTAINLGAAAFILLWWSCQSAHNWGRIGAFAIASFLFLWASMLRWESGLLIGIAAAPLLAHIVFASEKKWYSSLGKIGTLAALALIAMWLSLSKIQENEGWVDFYERFETGVVGGILDYGWESYHWNETTAPIYQAQVGWNYNDYNLYKHWFMADSSVYGTAQFMAIRESMGDRPKYSKEGILHKLKSVFYDNPWPSYWYLGGLSFLLCLFLAGASMRFSMRWVLLGTVLLSLALMLAMMTLRHLPARVSYPMIWYNIQLLLLFVGLRDQLFPKQKILLAFVFAGIFLAGSRELYIDIQKTKERKANWDAALIELAPQKDQLFVAAGCRYYENTALPLFPIFRKPFTDFQALDFGHLSNTPTYYRQLEKMGFSNIFTEMIDNERVFFVSSPGSPFLDWYKAYLLDHYRKNIRYELYKEHPSLNTSVYRVLSDTTVVE